MYGHEGVSGRYSSEDIFRGAEFNFEEIFKDLGFDFAGAGGFRNIFDVLFGGAPFGGFGFGGRRRGEDIVVETAITLEDVLRGKQTEIDFPRTVACGDCNGSGATPGTKPRACSICGGSGQARNVSRSGFGTFVSIEPCRTCQGRGSIIEKPCKACRGSGHVRATKRLKISIPAGVEDGNMLRVSGEGEPMDGGPSGDLYVRIRIKPHELFHRSNSDLLYDLKLSFAELALGTEAEVPTLDGPAKIKVPQGTQPNTIITLKGKGLPRQNGGGRGDELVRVNVKVPTNLSERQKELLRKLDESDSP
jgi:molecular chaperone DnaJ